MVGSADHFLTGNPSQMVRGNYAYTIESGEINNVCSTMLHFNLEYSNGRT